MPERSGSQNEKMNANAGDKIIVALDVPSTRAAREIIEELRDSVGCFKVGLQLFTSAGASFVRELVEDGIKIFLDVKFHDIPNTVAKAAVEAARLGVWMFNVHASGGGEMMRKTLAEVREACDKESLSQPKIIAVTVLTSTDQSILSEVGIDGEIDQQVLRLAKLASACGLDGVVASPREVRLIRSSVENDEFLIVTPGIRPDFATRDDQKRVMTPSQALVEGADYLVIGRPITQAENRLRAVQRVFEEIAGKQDHR